MDYSQRKKQELATPNPLPDDVFWPEFFRRFPDALIHATTERVTYADVPGPKDDYDLLGHARWALRDRDWASIDEWAARIRAQGFLHKREPKYGDAQLGWTLRSYANHKHSDVFETQGKGQGMRVRLRPQPQVDDQAA